MKKPKIIQLLSPGNWGASFGKKWGHSLIAWGLLDTGEVVGLIADGKKIISVQEVKSFSGYDSIPRP